MKRDFDSILTEILEIIAYPDDKQIFVQQFHELTYLEAMVNVIAKLPKEMQEKIKACDNDPEKIKQFISADLYSEELQRVINREFDDFIKSVSMELVPAQKKEIAELIASQ